MPPLIIFYRSAQCFPSKLLYLLLDIFNAAHGVPAGAVHGIPAKMPGAELGSSAAARQISRILFVHVLFALVAVVALGHQPLADRRVHLQVDDAVRCGQAQQMELVIEQPVQNSSHCSGGSLEHWCTALEVV